MRTAFDAPESALDQPSRDFVAGVRQHGWYRTGVSAEAGEPGFSYTTGFWITTGQPELVLFGLTFDIAHDVFWDLFRDAQKGVFPPVGERTRDIFANGPAYLFPVASEHLAQYLGWSSWFYAAVEFPCLQIVWPDRSGIFPWEEDFDSGFAGQQRDLSEHGWHNAIIG